MPIGSRPRFLCVVPLLLMMVLGPSALGQEVRTLDQVCGTTLSTDTIVREPGQRGPLSGCRILVDGAHLELDGANFRLRLLTVRGRAGASLSVIGSRLLTDLEVLGRFRRVSLADSLFQGDLLVKAAVRGGFRSIRCTFRDRRTRIEIDPGSLLISQVNFQSRTKLVTGTGGIEVRSSEVDAGLEASNTGPGDVALLKTTARGPLKLAGLGRVVVAGNTIRRIGRRQDAMELDGDIVLINSLIGIGVELFPQNSLLVANNRFKAGRPAISTVPANCVTLNNAPRIACRPTR